MKIRWLAFFLLIPVFNAWSITWDFNESGNDQGWRAKEHILSGGASMTLTMLNSEVYDGVLRVYPPPFETGRRPAISLISPPIHYNSELFDRMIIRLRVVHHRPFQGRLILAWINEVNQGHSGLNLEYKGHYFDISQSQNFTTEWQEIVVSDLRTRPVEGTNYSPILWEKGLVDIRIGLIVSDALLGTNPIGPEDIPEVIEVDWIQLTGVGEQLQGELSPPEFQNAEFGDLFYPAVFYPLDQKGIRSLEKTRDVSATLGDLDGDGYVDLATTYNTLEATGWLCAFNNGKGGFSNPQAFPAPPPYLQGGNINADDRMDILVTSSGWDHFKLLHNTGEGTWEMAQEFPGLYPYGWSDADGDGDGDLWMAEYPNSGGGFLWLFFNDVTGLFTRKEEIFLNNPEEKHAPSALVRHMQKGRTTGILWSRRPYGDPGHRVTHLDEMGNVIQDPLYANLNVGLMRYIDLDGDVDLVVTNEEVKRGILYHKEYIDLTFWINQGDGNFSQTEWHHQIRFPNISVEFFDLNGDGRLDPVVVDSNERDPVALVSLGINNGLPKLEGRYPLLGQGGQVLGEDVDNDGDVDLVVLEQNSQGQGGVHVLLNRLNNRSTAIQERSSSLPSEFHLGANYPNPFNPQTWIPFELPADSNPVQLRIYNLLGQPIRTLMTGPLSSGSHVVPWDGRDQAGQMVSSGLYLYCLQTRTWTATGKMVKSE